MKYGFVYIWYDRKHKRYYVGCRWGREDDGYICSSSWMKASYKRRPHDFKRRIIARIYTSRADLHEEEYRWLSMMKQEELHGPRYYNIRNHHFNHWSNSPIDRRSIGQKISEAPNRRENISKALKGRKLRTEKQKANLREAHSKQFANTEQRVLRSNLMLDKWQDPIYKSQMSVALSQWRWYNNGDISKKFKVGSNIPIEFKPGRLPFR